MGPEQALREVRSILKDNMYARHKDSRTGKLNTKRLWKYKTSPKVFSQPIEAKKKYNIEILLDASGSMVWQGFDQYVLPVLHKLLDVLQDCADVTITPFNYLEETYSVFEFKDEYYKDMLNIRKVTRLEKGETTHLVHAHAGAGYDYNAGAGNWETINLMNAAKRLEAKEGNGIILILQDGMQSLDHHSDDDDIVVAGQHIRYYQHEDYSNIVKSIQEKLKIPVISVGLGTSSPHQYFEHFIYADTETMDTDLYPALIAELRKVI